ncbi:MAG: GH3 auxin-responsive promoter family protein [Flavobacteriales bacterium]
MSLISTLSLIYAKRVHQKNKWWVDNPIEAQQKVLTSLVKKAQKTAFGKDHHFQTINNYSDFKKNVPIRDYEGLKKYIKKVKEGHKNILWPGIPMYFCKTSGTTSGVKYIPISKESMPFHIKCAKDAILNYIYYSGKTSFLNAKNIFIQGSPVLDFSSKTPIGRLSGIVAHHVPWYLKSKNLPSYKTNCIDDWETKIDAIVRETKDKNLGIISGIPPWVQMYFEKIKSEKNKSISQVFPNFSLFIYGGVNFEPYKNRFSDLIGKEIPSIETYPSSEGFIAYQDKQNDPGLLLCVNHGIFYEFIAVEDYFKESPKRISLEDVKTGVDYAIILNTNAGLWGYSIGDTVRFTSTKPYKLVVSGRIKHFTSAFGEHVIGKEVEEAIKNCCEKHPAIITEFHVAPQINPKNGLPFHEWFIEFKKEAKSMDDFCVTLDEEMKKQNTYYKDLIDGSVLRPLQISKLKENSFINYMKSVGKLGGQNKVPRLANDRKIGDFLSKFKI